MTAQNRSITRAVPLALAFCFLQEWCPWSSEGSAEWQSSGPVGKVEPGTLVFYSVRLADLAGVQSLRWKELAPELRSFSSL
jgi:hypothetical protein